MQIKHNILYILYIESSEIETNKIGNEYHGTQGNHCFNKLLIDINIYCHNTFTPIKRYL